MSVEKRDERMLELNAKGLANEEIQPILAKEFPALIVTARTIADRLWRMGAKAFSEGSSDQEQQEERNASQQLVEHMLDKTAEFIRDHKPMPPVPDKIRAVRIEDMGFNTLQEAVALFSDLHYYSRIDRRASNGLAEYNIDIARERFTRWRNGILRFTQIHQLVLEVKTLNILALGDDLEGHGEMFGSQALQMSESINFQILGFVEDAVDIILSFLERYEHINIVKVPGNHGRITARAKSAYTPDNFETLAWEMIAERIRSTTGGEWYTTDNGNRHLEGGLVDIHIICGAIGFVDIQGFLCALRHGHGIKGLNATYTGAIDNKLRLNSVIGEQINYYFKAHLHEAQSAEHEIRGETIQNGCFVGPSLLSIEMSRAAANIPSQEFFLFHPAYGRTHLNRIYLATVDEVRHLEVIGRDPK